MLTIKCSCCKTKLWKYDKIGKGELLRCYKSRINKLYTNIEFGSGEGEKITCTCGNYIGINKGYYVQMIKNSFTYSGTTR